MLMDENVQRQNEAAAAAASLTALEASVDASLTTITACGSLGMIYGPTHPGADAQDCLPALEVEPDGKIALSGGLQLGDHTVCDAEAEGTLRYVASQKTLLLCDGTSWVEVGAAPTAGGAFAPVTNAQLSQTYTSNSIQVSGFFGSRTATVNNGASILVNGTNQGASANVVAGDAVALRMASGGGGGDDRGDW